jgi:hypothetical protein
MAESKTTVTVRHSIEFCENSFWMFVWTIVAASILTLAYILCNRSLEGDKLIAQATDPVATACATGLGSTTTNQCTVLLARKN